MWLRDVQRYWTNDSEARDRLPILGIPLLYKPRQHMVILLCCALLKTEAYCMAVTLFVFALSAKGFAQQQ